MNPKLAFDIIKTIDLSQKEVSQLIDMLNGKTVKKRAKSKVISVACAKRDFKNRLSKRN